MQWMAALLIGVLLIGVAEADDAADAPRDFDGFWKTESDPAKLEVKFKEALAVAQAKAEPDVAYIAELTTQIARTLSMRRSFDKAHEHLNGTAKALDGRKCVALVRLHLERGRAYNSAGEREMASEYFKQALAVADELSAHYYAIDAMHMLGISEPPEQALEWNLKAIKVAENATSDRARRWRGALYNNTGWAYFESEEYEKALLYFRSNVAFRQEMKSDDRTGRYCVGKALRMLKRYEEALKIQRELEAGDKPTGFVIEELAELLWATGEKDAAKPYFVKAHEMLSAIPWVKSQTERMDSIRERAGLPKPEGEKQDDAKPTDEDGAADGE